MTRAEEFEELRPLLFSIAYRILGSVSEAEDAVQETWLRYAASPAQPSSDKAFLSAVVTRVSIDVLRSARLRREAYVGLPRPGRQDRQHLGPRHPGRADPDHPHGAQPRQAGARGSGRRRLRGPPRGVPGSPAGGLI